MSHKVQAKCQKSYLKCKAATHINRIPSFLDTSFAWKLGFSAFYGLQMGLLLADT